MLKLSEADMIARIRARDIFECAISDDSFKIKIESYQPMICTAVHAGHRLREPLAALCRLSAEERFYEEDPFTDRMIDALPITLVANDSRYEYDLNRPVATCIYRRAWGKEVWNKSPSTVERRKSIEKHQVFFRVLDVLVEALEADFGAAMVVDVHSYNHVRRVENLTPTFNIGTEQMDLDRWLPMVERAKNLLSGISLPNMPVVVQENAVFYGRGYLASHMNSRFQNTLVMPLELKKVFMDELTGEPYPLVMQSMEQQLKQALLSLGQVFVKRFTRKRRKAVRLLSDRLDAAVVNVDKDLYELCKGLETLHYINPVNIPAERKRFFKSNARYEPQFNYRQLDVDPYAFRQQLYRLPVNDIRDPTVQALYRDVVDAIGDKISLLVEAGQPGFLYESLRYYGEPTEADLKNASFVLHAVDDEEPSVATVNADALLERLTQAAQAWGMACKVEKSTKLAAAAMVSNARKAVLVNSDLCVTEQEANALVQHELGVHMATTLNSAAQRLKVFSLGLPGNTYAQEGLAILNEFQSGNMSLLRLKGLALRVLAVKEMIRVGDFRHTFSFLVEEHGLTETDAFKLAVRVHRGGGFTKDYLYLRGVGQAAYLASQTDISCLYVGKTGFDYLDTINEMINRGWVEKPRFYPEYLAKPEPVAPVLSYLVGCIRPATPIARARASYTGVA